MGIPRSCQCGKLLLWIRQSQCSLKSIILPILQMRKLAQSREAICKGPILRTEFRNSSGLCLIVDPALPGSSFCLPSTTGSSSKPIPGTRSFSSTQCPHSCPCRSSWLLSANWPHRESCRKAMLLGELSRKNSLATWRGVGWGGMGWGWGVGCASPTLLQPPRASALEGLHGACTVFRHSCCLSMREVRVS